MAWIVTLHKRVQKQLRDLPKPVRDALNILLAEIETLGPVRGDWKNYSKLGDHKHHCHIKTGRPTYVVVWQEIDQEIRLVEVQYAGTHEKAPY
ncbi:MAG: cytotoxic translational repressor of toxin-antitoxin stability system [Oryzomonas sp.]|jgi:mRNA-degrading endonuclease RelE of RelBE toxin-antitoxin system